MATEIIMPKVDMDMATGRIAAWHVAEGGQVEQGAPLFDIETDKASMEIESPATGILRHVVAGAGAEIPVGQPVAWIYRADESVGARPNAPPKAPPTAFANAESAPATTDIDPDAHAGAGKPGGVGRRATPLARTLARQNGIDLDGISGSGARGRIQAEDIRRATRPAPPSPLAARVTEIATAPVVALVAPTASGRPGSEPPALVLIHGFAGDAASWAPLEARLVEARLVEARLGGCRAAGERIVKLELPSHGAARHRPVASFAALVAAMLEEFDQLGLERAHLVGHSLGGAVALALADLRPRAVARLTLLAPAGLGPEIDGEVLLGLARARSAESLAPWLRALTADPEAISWNFVQAAMLRRADPALRAAQLDLAAALFPDGVQSFDLSAALDRVAVPARIVWGRRDRVVPWRHALRAPGRVSLNLFDACGHLPQLEQADAIARLLDAA